MTCQKCCAPTPGGNLCPACTVELAALLRRVRGLLPDLLVSMARQSKRGKSIGRVGKTEQPIPVDLAAGGAYTLLNGLLEAYGCLPVLAGPGWLTASARTIRDRANAHEAWRRLARAADVATRVIDAPPDSQFIGMCSMPKVDGTHCLADVYALDGAAEGKCGQCGASHPVAPRRAVLLRAVEDVAVTGPDLARAVTWLGGSGKVVTPELIRQWAHRGKLVATGRNAKGQPLYRVGDALAIVRSRVRA